MLDFLRTSTVTWSMYVVICCGSNRKLIPSFWLLLFFFLRFFLMWTIFKVFIEFVTILLLFYVLVFWPRGMWDLSSPTKEGGVLTTGTPGKSHNTLFSGKKTEHTLEPSSWFEITALLFVSCVNLNPLLTTLSLGFLICKMGLIVPLIISLKDWMS